MISFTPVAHGEIDYENDRFVIDNKLEPGLYLINIDEPAFGQTCSCFLKVVENRYSTSTAFVPYEDLDYTPVVLYYWDEEPLYLTNGTGNMIPEDATIEVIRIA